MYWLTGRMADPRCGRFPGRWSDVASEAGAA
jgi:hypothetical protein